MWISVEKNWVIKPKNITVRRVNFTIFIDLSNSIKMYIWSKKTKLSHHIHSSYIYTNMILSKYIIIHQLVIYTNMILINLLCTNLFDNYILWVIFTNSSDFCTSIFFLIILHVVRPCFFPPMFWFDDKSITCIRFSDRYFFGW